MDSTVVVDWKSQVYKNFENRIAFNVYRLVKDLNILLEQPTYNQTEQFNQNDIDSLDLYPGMPFNERKDKEPS